MVHLCCEVNHRGGAPSHNVIHHHVMCKVSYAFSFTIEKSSQVDQFAVDGLGRELK